jgi:hypothetical protein
MRPAELAWPAVVIAAAVLFWTPVLIAAARGTERTGTVVLLTMLTLLLPPAWFVALVASFLLPPKGTRPARATIPPNRPSPARWQGAPVRAGAAAARLPGCPQARPRPACPPPTCSSRWSARWVPLPSTTMPRPSTSPSGWPSRPPGPAGNPRPSRASAAAADPTGPFDGPLRTTLPDAPDPGAAVPSSSTSHPCQAAVPPDAAGLPPGTSEIPAAVPVLQTTMNTPDISIRQRRRCRLSNPATGLAPPRTEV